MKKLTIHSQNNYFEIDSEDVKNIIESFDGVGEVRNISESVDNNVMAFDVLLSSSYMEDLLSNQIEDIDYSSDDEKEAILFEQAEYISDALLDNVREFFEGRHNIDSLHGAYEIYKASLEEGIGLMLTLSFGQVKHGRLYKIASHLNDRNMELR